MRPPTTSPAPPLPLPLSPPPPPVPAPLPLSPPSLSLILYLPYFSLSYLTLPYLTLLLIYFTLSYPLPCLTFLPPLLASLLFTLYFITYLTHLILTYSFFPHLILPHLILSYPTLPYLIFPYLSYFSYLPLPPSPPPPLSLSLSTPSPPNLPNLLTHNRRSPYESPSRLEGIPTVERPRRKRHLPGRTVGDHIPGAKNVPPWYSKPRVKGGPLGVHKPIG